MKNKTKKIIVLLVIISMGLGFAVLSSNLSLSNLVKISDSSFDVHFDIVEVSDTTLENPTYTINSDNNQVTFNASFDKPGDYVEYGLRVINAGTIDAELNSFQVTGIDNSNVNYSLKYYDGSSLAKGDFLRVGTTKRIVFRLEYNYDINELEEVPDISATVSLSYIQPKSINENVWDFDYQEEVQTFIANKAGRYKIEAWGAQGGIGSVLDMSSSQGYGGYATGVVNLAKDEKLYMSVGQAGSSSNSVLLEKSYNGGGSALRPAGDSVLNSSGGGGTSVFLSDDVQFYYAKDLLNQHTDGVGGQYTDDQVYIVGNSVVFKYPKNFNIYRFSIKDAPVGSYYKVEWRGENLDDPKIEYDGGYYTPDDHSTFIKNTGAEIISKRITNNTVEIYYKVTEANYSVEFRIQTRGAQIVLHSKTVSLLNQPLIVAGGGGGTHLHGNGQSHAGSGGGYIGGSSVNIFQLGSECKSAGGGTQSEGGMNELRISHNEDESNGKMGLGGNYVGVKNHGSYGAGGGSGYYGGAAGINGAGCAFSGAGGSGYIANPRLSSKEMYCYGCQESTDTNTKTTKTTSVSATPTSKNAKIGNGHVRITYIN